MVHAVHGPSDAAPLGGLNGRRWRSARFGHSPLAISSRAHRSAHSHGSQYSTVMQPPSLLTSHVTLATAQPLNVGVAHVVRQQQSSSLPSKKNKQAAPGSSK